MLMNASMILVIMEEPASILMAPTNVNVWKAGKAMTARRVSNAIYHSVFYHFMHTLSITKVHIYMYL